MLVPEKPIKESSQPMDWEPLVRLLVMTGVFTIIILGSGQLVKLVSSLLLDITSPTVLFIVMGMFGLAGMLIAVAMGVWLCVRISLGDAARENPSFTWWVINRLAFLVGAVNLSTFAVYFLQARLGYEKEAAAAPASQLILFVGLFILLSTLPAGWLTDRFGEKRMVALAGLVPTGRLAHSWFPRRKQVATWASPTWQVRVLARWVPILVVPSPILSLPRCPRLRALVMC
jgi:hypothetical protein